MSVYKNYILVVGGAGFIGSCLCKQLLKSKKNYVICLDNLSTGSLQNISAILTKPNFEFVSTDINDGVDFLNIYKINQVYYLLTFNKSSHKQFHGLKNIFAFSKNKNSKLLFILKPNCNSKNNMFIQKGTYWGKVTSTDSRDFVSSSYLQNFANYEDVVIKIAYIHNLYGTKSTKDVVANFIKSAKNNDNLTIYGDGSQTRSFLLVNDLVNGLKKFMDSTFTHPLEFGSNDIYTINKLAEKITTLKNSKSEISYLKAPYNIIVDKTINKDSFAKTHKILDWYPQIEIDKWITIS